MRLTEPLWAGVALFTAVIGITLSSYWIWHRSIGADAAKFNRKATSLPRPPDELGETSVVGVLAGSGLQQTNPSILSRDFPRFDDERVLQGRYLFERHCAACHGRWGDGRGELAEGMHPKPRKLTAGVFKFRSTPTGSLPMDLDLERTIRRGIANSSMPSFQHLPSRDVDALIVFVKTLSSNWRRQAQPSMPMSLPAEPAWLYLTVESETHRVVGKELFAANCAPCHGERGDGSSEIAKSLEDVWGQPCAPSDLRHEGLKCGPELMDIFRVLVTGLDGTPMPSFREAFTDEQLWDVVAYIASLRRKPAMDATKAEELDEP